MSFTLANDNIDLVRDIQNICADIHERGGEWGEAEAKEIANLFNICESPWGLFRWMDESTGHFSVGYETRDGREWFHILRQMRNKPGPGGLFEYMEKK